MTEVYKNIHSVKKQREVFILFPRRCGLEKFTLPEMTKKKFAN